MIVQEEAGIGPARTGHVMATVGKILFWVDFLLLAFVYVGVRSGSFFWVWWVLSQAILAAILMAVGMQKRKHAVIRSHGPGGHDLWDKGLVKHH